MAINTYFQNIANAIRTKTGSAGLITPAEMPDEILNIPAGDSGVDLTSINFIGFVITAQRSYDSYIQVCNVRFLDSSDNMIELPINACTFGAIGGTPLTSATEGADKMWRSDALTNHYKTIINKSSGKDFYIFWLKNVAGIDLSNAVKYQWYTAEDSPSRDPISFGIVFANGDETDGILKMMNFASNQTIPTNRNVLAYEGGI